jgi:flagellin-specific chaperone FliS
VSYSLCNGIQINALKAQEREFAEARNQSMHRVTEIRTQLKSMLRMDEKIAEAENKIYSLRSELARVRIASRLWRSGDRHI